MTEQTTAAILYNRQLPTSGETEAGDGGINAFNLMFVVGFALLISVLARWLANRGRRK